MASHNSNVVRVMHYLSVQNFDEKCMAVTKETFLIQSFNLRIIYYVGWLAIDQRRSKNFILLDARFEVFTAVKGHVGILSSYFLVTNYFLLYSLRVNWYMRKLTVKLMELIKVARK
jgi:hypothetical protein